MKWSFVAICMLAGLAEGWRRHAKSPKSAVQGFLLPPPRRRCFVSNPECSRRHSFLHALFDGRHHCRHLNLSATSSDQDAASSSEAASQSSFLDDLLDEVGNAADADVRDNFPISPLPDFTKQRQFDVTIPAPVQELRANMTHLVDDDSLSLQARAEQVEEILYRLVDDWQDSLRGVLGDDAHVMAAPTTADFGSAYQAWNEALQDGNGNNSARRLNTAVLPVAMQRVGGLWRTQQELLRASTDSAVEQGLRPDPTTATVLLQVLSTSREADRQTWSVFESLRYDHHITPTATMYHAVIVSLAKSRSRGAAQRAEEVLREAVKVLPPTHRTGMSVDTFNVVVTAWAKSGLEYAAERAEKLLVWMDELGSVGGSMLGNDDVTFRPNMHTFTSLIDAYAQSNEWPGILQAERVLNRLVDLHLQGDIDSEPNVATWTIVMSAWSRLARRKGKADAAYKALRLLQRLESLHAGGRISFAPDVIAYTTCMNAFAFCRGDGQAPQQAESILNEMHERYMDGVDSMKPSAKSVKIVLEAYAKSEAAGAMDQAELMFGRYSDLFDEYEGRRVVGNHGTSADGNNDYVNVRESYKLMLYGWAQHAGDPVRAQDYLNDMLEKNMQPDCLSFDKVIESNTQVNDRAAMARTRSIMQLAEEQAAKGLLQPNERLYTSYIRAMTKAHVSNLAQEANDILDLMKRLHQEGSTEMKPSKFSYNAVLYACADSRRIEGNNNGEAFQIAMGVFNELRKLDTPDYVSFGNLLACSKLLPAGHARDQLVASTFRLCAKQGMVNVFVVRDLQGAADEGLWRKLLQWDRADTEVDVDRLPTSWRRNCKPLRTASPVRGPSSARVR